MFHFLPVPPNGPVQVMKKLERLFESLVLQLPCHGKCPDNVASAFSGTLHMLAYSTALLWCDSKGRMVRNLVHYFVGRSSAERIDSTLIGDDELESLVLARLPYVSQLHLNADHFVMREVDITNDLKIDLRNKIRYVDTVLAKNSSMLHAKEKNLIESYYTAREICVKNSFIQNKNYVQDIVSKVGEPSKVGECVILLRHLLRVMCTSRNIKKLELDDKFFQFLMHLHEALYSWSDTSTMVEVIERSRCNIFAYLRGITVDQMLIDKEFTKAKLEHIEKELYRHLNHLTLRQVQREKDKRGHGILIRGDSESRNLRPVESESSIYTMAMSASSFAVQRQQSLDHSRLGDLDLMHHQLSMDQSSIVSGSSMYATAASISSGENAPLIACSPPSPRSQESPKHHPDCADENTSLVEDPNEFYETAV